MAFCDAVAPVGIARRVGPLELAISRRRKPATALPATTDWVGRTALRRSHRLATRMMANQRDAELRKWIENNLDFGKVKDSGGIGMGGSGWSQTATVSTESGKRLFIKTSSRPAELMFTGEAEGLRAMHATNTLVIPNVYHYGDFKESDGSFIIMEYLNMGGSYSQADLGRQLAQMHQAEPSASEAKQGKFGFVVDNTIGGTSQPNGWTDNYVDFFREKRLRHQLKLARDSTLSKLGDKLMDSLDSYFEGTEVRPCILHGDLWSGNIGGVDGQPTIFDPACYYGHSEAEFGMSWCANFGRQFWDAYFSIIPKAEGFEDRKQIYLLYHYLNHYNLFGGGYYNSALSILRSLVGEKSSANEEYDRFYEL